MDSSSSQAISDLINRLKRLGLNEQTRFLEISEETRAQLVTDHVFPNGASPTQSEEIAILLHQYCDVLDPYDHRTIPTLLPKIVNFVIKQRAEKEREIAKERAQKEREIANERAEKEKAEKEIAKERAEKEKAEKEKMSVETGYGSFLERKLFPVVRGHGSSSSNVAREVHKAATLVVKKFGDLTEDHFPLDAKIANTLLGKIDPQTGSLVFDTEAGLASFVEDVLQDARNWLGLKGDLRISREYYLSAVRPDVVLIMGRELGVPIGVVEVKIPDHRLERQGTINSPNLHGQLLNYLRTLRYLYGVEHPLGIATTYQHWRICWLPESDEWVAATENEHFKQLRSSLSLPRVIPLTPPDLFQVKDIPLEPIKFQDKEKGKEKEKEKKKEKEKEKAGDPKEIDIPKGTEIDQEEEQQQTKGDLVEIARALHGTDPITFDDEKLTLHLVSVLAKMTSTKICRKQAIEIGQVFPFVSNSSLDWKKLASLPLHPPNFPHANTKSFFLLRELGHGQEGRVYEACSESGCTCALKIFKSTKNSQDQRQEEDLKKRVEEEVQVWKTAWKIPTVYSTTLMGNPALVMPLVLTAPDQGSSSLENKIPEAIAKHPELLEATKKALTDLDQANYMHNDLHWRHVGFYREAEKEKNIKAVLIDLALGKKSENSLTAMLERLGLSE